MKKILLVLFIGIIGFSNSKAQDLATASGYLGFILEKQKVIAESMWDYIKTKAHSDRDKKVSRKKDDLIKTIKQEGAEIRLMPAFEGSTTLRDSMVVYLESSINILNGDYTEIEKLETKAQTSYEFMKLYLKKMDEANDKYEKMSESISKQIDIFAEENNINLVDNNSKLHANLKISNIVYGYYNNIYLIFFRGYIEDTFIIEAVNNQDTVSLKQRVDSLTVAYKYGDIDLKSTGSYNGDYTLRFTCQKSLNHYKKEATVYIPKILDYFRAESELNLAKQKYNSIPQKEVTQGDIDAYNFAISKYNNAIKVYNETIKNLNDDIKNNVEQWNDAVDKFLGKHIPKK